MAEVKKERKGAVPAPFVLLAGAGLLYLMGWKQVALYAVGILTFIYLICATIVVVYAAYYAVFEIVRKGPK